MGNSMPLIDPLVVSSLVVLASSGDVCKMPKPTEITITPSTEKVQVISNKTLAEMQNEQIDTINPHSFNGVSVTQGFAQGKIRMQAEVKLDSQAVMRGRAGCIWYETINVKFLIDPYIYIAKEVQKDRCMGRAVLEHEMKHVHVDRQVVNKYSREVGRKIFEGLEQRGFIAGPIRPEDYEATAERMRQTVKQIIDLEMKRLELDRLDMQTAVDSKEEYDRVAAQCPKFKITNDMMQTSAGRRSGR